MQLRDVFVKEKSTEPEKPINILRKMDFKESSYYSRNTSMLSDYYGTCI